jgi:hypothetical protein
MHIAADNQFDYTMGYAKNIIHRPQLMPFHSQEQMDTMPGFIPGP